jgi:hypothetical protein
MAESAVWERQAAESAKAYAAFCVYRDLPAAQRSGVRVASEIGRHMRLVERWRSGHRWVERAAAFDQERDRRKREAMLEETAEMGRRQAADAAAAQAAVMRVLAAFAVRLDDADGQAELRDLPLDEFLPLVLRAIPSFAAAARLEREARGLLDESGASETAWEPPPVYRKRSPERFKELVLIGLENGDYNDVLAEKGLEVVDKARAAEAAVAFRAEVERLSRLKDEDIVP